MSILNAGKFLIIVLSVMNFSLYCMEQGPNKAQTIVVGTSFISKNSIEKLVVIADFAKKRRNHHLWLLAKN